MHRPDLTRATAFAPAAILSLAALLGVSACQPAADADALLGAAGATAPINRVNDSVVARVEGTSLYRSDVQRAAAAQGLIAEGSPLSMTDPVFDTVLEELIDQRLLALDAARGGLAQSDEAQRRLASARERILGNLRVETHLSEQVTETAIRELYEAQRQLANRGEERRARHIVVEDEATAQAILRRLADEEDFEVLATEFSTDEATRALGGDLGWISRDMLAAALRSAVFETPVGERAAPVSAPDGWHIVEVLDQRTPGQLSFEETREDIARFMTFDAIQSLVTELRDAADIERLADDTTVAPDQTVAPDGAIERDMPPVNQDATNQDVTNQDATSPDPATPDAETPDAAGTEPDGDVPQ